MNSKGQVGLGLKFLTGSAFLIVLVFVFAILFVGCGERPDLVIRDVSENNNINSNLISFLDSEIDGIKIIDYIKLNKDEYDVVVDSYSKDVFDKIYFGCYEFEIKDSIGEIDEFEIYYPVLISENNRFVNLKVDKEFYGEKSKEFCGVNG